MKHALLATALAISISPAHAELMNISSTSRYSDADSAIACTIIDTGTIPVSGGVLLYVFAESNGSDPSLRVWSLQRDLTVTNENWQDGFTLTGGGRTVHYDLSEFEGGNPYATLLRSPARITDAAVMFPGLRGESFCAESYDRSGARNPVNVQIAITDLNAIAYRSVAYKALGMPVPDSAPTPDLLESLVKKFNK